MPISIRSLHPRPDPALPFVGEVTGIDISSPLSPDQVAEVEAGMDRHAVLVFRDQPLTDEQPSQSTVHEGGAIPISGAARLCSGTPRLCASFDTAAPSTSAA